MLDRNVRNLEAFMGGRSHFLRLVGYDGKNSPTMKNRIGFET